MRKVHTAKLRKNRVTALRRSLIRPRVATMTPAEAFEIVRRHHSAAADAFASLCSHAPGAA